MSSDWELHEICSSRKESITQLAPFLLSDEQVFGVSGKMNKLKEILDNLKKGLFFYIDASLKIFVMRYFSY